MKPSRSPYPDSFGENVPVHWQARMEVGRRTQSMDLTRLVDADACHAANAVRQQNYGFRAPREEPAQAAGSGGEIGGGSVRSPSPYRSNTAARSGRFPCQPVPAAVAVTRARCGRRTPRVHRRRGWTRRFEPTAGWIPTTLGAGRSLRSSCPGGTGVTRDRSPGSRAPRAEAVAFERPIERRDKSTCADSASRCRNAARNRMVIAR
jgi:hypothetical protein